MSLFFNINFTIYDNDFEIYIPSFWNHNNTLHIRFYNISTGPIGLHRMKNVCMHIFLFNDLSFFFYYLFFFVVVEIFRHRIFETGVQIDFRTGRVLSVQDFNLGSPSRWNFGPGCGVEFCHCRFQSSINEYQSINTFHAEESKFAGFLLFPLPSFIVFCVSETSYIQCIVCIAAVYFDTFRYFKLLGEGPISSFLTKLLCSWTYFSTHSRVFLLLVIAIVFFFPSCVSTGFFWI